MKRLPCETGSGKRHSCRFIAELVAAAALALTGCSVTKIEYNTNGKGETSYKIYRNGHWLKTEADSLAGGMTKNGAFEFSADGLKQSPSEEFNRTMQTYTGAFLQLARIVAAATGRPVGEAALLPLQTTPQAADCADGSCNAPAANAAPALPATPAN